MIKHVLTFVSGVQKSVLVDFISQILHKVKTLSKFSLSKISLQKRTKLDFFLNF